MEDVFVGLITLFPYDFTPLDWAPCDGRTLNIMQNQALYSLLGIKFGGDGRTTFGLPDLRNAAPIQGTAYYISLSGIYPTRD